MSTTMGPQISEPTAENYLLFDGECPFCTAYVRLMQLRKAGIDLQIISARDRPDLVRQFRASGMDVDQGMILQVGSTSYFAADVMTVLALMSGRNSWFNVATGWFFGKPQLARAIYPILRAARNLTLRVLGRSKIAT